MSQPIVGRKKEIQQLHEALQSQEAEFVAVLGRRRVGKTFLVSTTYKDKLVFELSGIQNSKAKIQLTNFRDELVHWYGDKRDIAVPADWLTAFNLLRQYLVTIDTSEKKVLFFDELPWLSGHKSGFLEALGYFWNSWASRQNLVIVICGSAASWMIRRVIHDKGGLHNRITKRIFLQPFTLHETELFLQSKDIAFDRYQILQLYMALGGVPHYLKEVKSGFSASQNIDRICFSTEGSLFDEFTKLYSALFTDSHRHLSIIRALSGKWKGLDRNEIIEKTKLTSGNNLSMLLEELEQSGFITSYAEFGKKSHNKTYRLTDPYSLFYIHFIENRAPETGLWLQISQTQQYKSWTGYAFENIALLHVPQIKKGLGIAGIYAPASSYYQKQTDQKPGAQIDLLLDRKDHVINLFEIKFYEDVFVPDSVFADGLRNKKMVFKQAVNTKKQLSWAMIAPFGIKHNQHSLGLIDNVLTMDALFEEA